MALVRWNPFSELERIQREVNRLFDDTALRRLTSEGDEPIASAWVPPVDIAEDKDNITITVDLPGLDRDDVHVAIEDNRLTISGERKFEKKSEDREWSRVERAYGAFTRTFSLPNVVDTDRVEAKMDRGVLTIVLPKREEAKPKQIEVKVA
ncbi:MAG: Hsp20/alpha crystallin family protein [Acidobacteriota bacterium]|nr:MAG: Hsp20/alpha crystallin family protein [Acidobacteriota bacterium]